MEDFVVRAFIAGIGIAIVSGPLGSFIVWRKMAYFGATLSHGALLGVAMALMSEMAPFVGVLIVGLAMVPVLRWLQRSASLPSDTLLGLLAHGMLALGLILLAFLPQVRVDLMGYLFGDVLAVTVWDIAIVYVGGAIVIITLLLNWRALLASTVNSELSAAEGLHPERASTLFMFMTAIVIAIAMKVVGVLLIVSLLIIPAAAARSLSRTPEQMAAIASIIGAASTIIGLSGAIWFDTPAGPSIVVAALLLFLLGLLPSAAGLDQRHS